MVVLIRIIALAITLIGFTFFKRPDLIKKPIGYFKENKRIYLAGIIRLFLGFVFIMGASACRVSQIVTIMGILTLIGALLIFGLGAERVKVILNWWLNKPIKTLRMIALIPIIVGILLLYAA